MIKFEKVEHNPDGSISMPFRQIGCKLKLRIKECVDPKNFITTFGLFIQIKDIDVNQSELIYCPTHQLGHVYEYDAECELFTVYFSGEIKKVLYQGKLPERKP